MTVSFSTKILQGLVLTCLLVQGVTGLQCLECQEVYNPDDCSLVGTCGRDEVCFTRQFINFRDRPSYRMGCEQRDVCEFYKNQVHQQHVVIGRRATGDAPCRQCCEDDFCNAVLCRDTHTTQTTGQSSSASPPPTLAGTESVSAGLTTTLAVSNVSSTSSSVSSTASSSATSAGSTATTAPNTTMRDCMDYFDKGFKTSGVYQINPDELPPFSIYCDMTTNGGGWMVVQRRFNGSVDFRQNWETYKDGFGSLDGEFWLGNELLHRLTALPGTNYTLRFLLTEKNGTVYTAEYDGFIVATEGDGYRVNFTDYHGNAGDSFRDHRGMQFSTVDHDRDTGQQNCAELYQSGWWYHKCYEVNINGVYGSNGDLGLIWKGLTGWTGSLAATSMSIRSLNP